MLAARLVRLTEIEEGIVDELAARVLALEGLEQLDGLEMLAAVVGPPRAQELTLGARDLDRTAPVPARRPPVAPRLTG